MTPSTPDVAAPLAPFHFVRKAPNPFGKPFPWYQVVSVIPGVSESIELDFMFDGPIADAIARKRNLKRHDPS